MHGRNHHHLSSIRTGARRKSPGPDGIPNEFYLRVFDVIHREMNLILNEALSGNVAPEFVEGVIVLVKKRGGDDTAKSYRPISLLNADYKIFSRILKRRLENVIITHRILGAAQKCANSPHNIFQAILSIKDRLAQIKQNRQHGKLISFDLDHAFDRVRHTFLHNTMSAIGINRDFVSLLSRIAQFSFSRLMVNGHLSETFQIQRSVRQGDPISSLLFVIYLHPLISKLEEVRGDNLVVAYADDVSVITSSVDAINEMYELFARYGRVSGAKLNVNKTKSINIGSFSVSTAIQVPWLQTENAVKILGITFANSIRYMVKLNWDAQVTKFAQQLWLHSLRTLTLHQKILWANTYITSRIWYLSSTIPPSNVHIAKITASLGTFLWSRFSARIPMQQLARSRPNGGLKLQLPALKCKALLLSRQLKEMECTPFYKSIIHPERPNPTIPFDLPDLKQICTQLSELPAHLVRNPTSDLIHRSFIEQTDQPKVERNHPTLHWPRIWTNIGLSRLNSSEKTALYILVNGKISHRKLLFTLHRSDGENCLDCNTAIETIKHKFCECPRVAPTWTYLQQRINSILPGSRRLSFDQLHRPLLENIPQIRRVQILKTFISYITFINSSNDRIDIQALEFHLNCEV